MTISTPSRKSPWFFLIEKDITENVPQCEATPVIDDSKDGGFNFKLPSLKWPTFGSGDLVEPGVEESSKVIAAEGASTVGTTLPDSPSQLNIL